MAVNAQSRTWLRTLAARAGTLIVGWGVLGAAFVYRPDWLKWWLRSVTKWIEQISDVIPYPWGDRIEIFVRTVGASVWLQIALVIVAVRIIAWLIGAAWRRSRGADAGRLPRQR
jgi:hypothetical protein